MRTQCGRQWWNAWAFVLVVACCLLLSRAEGAVALPIVSGQGADWGLKESLRDYVEDSGGAIAVGDGATRNEDGSFHFPVAGGSYDPISGETVVAFGGSVQLNGDRGQVDLRVSNLSVEIVAAGAWLFADVSRGSIVDGGRVSYPHAVLAELSASGVEPTVAGGTTTWSEVPAALTSAGASALGNLYQPGTPLDAFGFSYEGPGGKPRPEDWSKPGAPSFEQIAAEATPAETVAMFLDHDHGVIHAVSPAGLRALSRSSLELLGGRTPAAPLPPSGYAFDPDGTVFAVPDSSVPAPVRAFTWNPTLRVYEEEELPIDAVNSTHLAYSEVLDILYAVEGTGSPATLLGGSLSPSIALAARGGGGWSTLARPPLETESSGVSGLTVTTTGSLVATMHPHYVDPLTPEAIAPSTPAKLVDNGANVEVRRIWNGLPPQPPAGTYTSGYTQAVPQTDGTVTLVEPSPPAPTAHAVETYSSDWTFEVREPFELGPGVRSYVLDDVNDTGYALNPQLERISVFRESEAVATIVAAPAGAAALEPSVGLASDDVLYFHNEVEPEGIYAYRKNAEGPTVVSQPQDAVATLAEAGGSTGAFFSATATAEPAPTLRWQVRRAGSAVWADLPGATESILTVTARVAAAGDRYRAVFSNSAGEVATRAASLSVRVLPPGRAGDRGGEPAQATGSLARRPARTSMRPALRPARGRALVVRANGVATLAWVSCPPLYRCLLELPKRIALRIGGDRFPARLLAPGAVLPDRLEPIRLRLSRAAREAIAGTAAQATVPVTVVSREHRLERTVAVILRGRER